MEMKILDDSLLQEIKINAVRAVELMFESGDSVHAFDIGTSENTGDDVIMVMQLCLRRDLPDGLIPIERTSGGVATPATP